MCVFVCVCIKYMCGREYLNSQIPILMLLNLLISVVKERGKERPESV
jgi:hypothetical protein